MPFGPRFRKWLFDINNSASGASTDDMADDQDCRLPPETSMSILSERHTRASDLHVRRWRRLIAWNRSGSWFRFDGGFGEFLVANLSGEYPEASWIVGDQPSPTWELVQDWSKDR